MSGVHLLHAALCDAFSELKNDLPHQPQTEDFLDRIYQAWDYMANRPEQQFLLVVDGLDEAVNQWFLKRRVLPAELPPNLHVLISARHKPGHETGLAWLQDLGVQVLVSADSEQAESKFQWLEVSTLEQSAVAEAVVQLGHPLDQLTERESFVEALYHLTDQGDPLLVSLWLGLIWEQRDRAPNFDAATLKQFAPSYAGFYRRWIEDQQKVWKAHGLIIHLDDFGQVMHVLALAKAPLLLDNLFAVLEQLKSPVHWEFEKLRAALESAHRVVVGDGKEQGFVLVHPRLVVYFRQELSAKPAQLRAVQQAFLAWGANTVTRLNTGDMSPDACPAYLLRHYVSGHIPETGLKGEDAVENYYLPLLQRGWPLAWQAYEGAWLGYLNDLRRVFKELQAYNMDCQIGGRPAAMHLAAEVRYALLVASIHTLNNQLPLQLIVALARNGIWSFSRAARVAMQYAEPSNQVECLIELAGIAVQIDAQPLLQQAMDAAIAINVEWLRIVTLSAVAAQLQGEMKQQVLQEALDAAMEIADEESRAEGLRAVAAQLQGEMKQRVLQEALDAATAIDDEWPRAVALSDVAAQLQGEMKQRVLQQALDAATVIGDEWSRTRALSAVAAQLQGESALLQQALNAVKVIKHDLYRDMALSVVAAQLQEESALLQQVLDATTLMKHDLFRVGALCAVGAQMRGESKQRVLQQALDVATAIKDESSHSKALTKVAAQLQGESALLQQVLNVAMAIKDEFYRAEVLSAVAEQLQGESKQRVVQQALDAATVIKHDPNRRDALIALARQLPGESKKQVLLQALDATTVIKDEQSRALALSAVAAQLQGASKQQVLQEALDTAIAINYESDRGYALRSVAAQLHGESALLRHILNAATAIKDEQSRAYALRDVAAQMQGEMKQQVLQLALDAATAIDDEMNRCYALRAVAVELREERALLQHILGTATAIKDDQYRSEALSAVAAQLQGESKERVLQQALDAATAIKDESSRTEALTEVAAQLQGESALLQQVLNAATEIKDEWSRADVLSAVAAQLQGESKQRVLQQALDAATAINKASSRAHALSAVAAQLQGENKQRVLQQALDAMMAINPDSSALVLGSVAAQVREYPELEQQCLDLALSLHDDRKMRITIAANLTDQNPALLTLNLWCDWLNHTPLERDDLLACIGCLTQAAVQLTGDPQQAEQIARAVVDVGEWWA